MDLLPYLMTNLGDTLQALERLKLGTVGIHVDDFGTGYSSLSYLCRLPIDGLKIDRSSVAHMLDSPESLEVIRAIVRLGETLGMSVTAEGVEPAGQLTRLRELSCPYAQGFFFGRPPPPEDLDPLITGLAPQA